MGDYLPNVNLGSGIKIQSIEPGEDHCCAILVSGNVKCFGRNSGWWFYFNF